MEKKKVVKKTPTKPRKKWVNSTKITQHGITFDSTLELSMYNLLTEAGIPFKYIGGERAKYTLLEESKYLGGCYERAQKRSAEMKNTQKITSVGYTPDFVGEGESWFIEVKGRKLGDFAMRWKLFKRMMSQREPMPKLFMPTNLEDCKQVIKILKDLKNE